MPAGYTEANSTAEIVPAVGNGGLADAVFGSTADGTSMAAPKKAGVIRIGVLEPVNHTDRDLSGRFLRQDVVAKLNKGLFDALPLAGTSPAEIQQEAAKLQCDYILFTDITEVKTSKPGGIGGAMKKVSGGGDNKDKQDVKLDYKLFAVDATQAPKFSGKAQASTGGFGVGSALKMAAFAGQMYMSVMGMGGLTSSMMGLSGMTGMGGGMGMYDPRMSAMASMAASVGMSAMAGGGGAHGRRRLRPGHAQHCLRRARQRREGDDGSAEQHKEEVASSVARRYGERPSSSGRPLSGGVFPEGVASDALHSAVRPQRRFEAAPGARRARGCARSPRRDRARPRRRARA